MYTIYGNVTEGYNGKEHFTPCTFIMDKEDLDDLIPQQLAFDDKENHWLIFLGSEQHAHITEVLSFDNELVQEVIAHFNL